MADRLSEYLICEGFITKEDKNIFVYGINHILFLACNFITYIILGLLQNRLFETILFVTVFASIRKYSGGCHASNRITCYFSSLILIQINILLSNKIYLSTFEYVFWGALAAIVIVLLSPKASKNNPLSKYEEIIFWIKSCKTVLMWFIIMIFLSAWKMRYANAILVAIYQVAILMLI